MIIFTKWFCRLGNNIIQLSNIIDIAIANKHNITFQVKHPLFNLNIIENYFNKYNNKKILRDKNNFFYKNKLSFSSKIFEKNIEERNKLLKDAFLIKDIKKLNKNDLVIHLRSGDIFSNFPHSVYLPPPLSFFTKYINKYNYRKIIIVCEDNYNPVVNKLLKLYKNSVYNKNSLKDDIQILLGASNIIFSIGSFVPSLMLISNNIKNINGVGYYDKLQDTIPKNNKSFYNEKFNSSELQNYYKIMYPWKNTKKQRDYILTYEY